MGLAKRLGLLVAASACLLAGSAAAQEWPARPVRIVNTFAPGGAADILGAYRRRSPVQRVQAAVLRGDARRRRRCHRGADGRELDPDGYNFVISTLSLTIIALFINPKIGYDPLKDLTHVGYIAGTPTRSS